MPPRLKEIERLKKGPKPRNVKERIDLFAERADHYLFGKWEKLCHVGKPFLSRHRRDGKILGIGQTGILGHGD